MQYKSFIVVLLYHYIILNIVWWLINNILTIVGRFRWRCIKILVEMKQRRPTMGTTLVSLGNLFTFFMTLNKILKALPCGPVKWQKKKVNFPKKLTSLLPVFWGFKTFPFIAAHNFITSFFLLDAKRVGHVYLVRSHAHEACMLQRGGPVLQTGETSLLERPAAADSRRIRENQNCRQRYLPCYWNTGMWNIYEIFFDVVESCWH